MALREFLCDRCDKKFLMKPEKLNCEDGRPHTVAEKIYYIPTEGLTVGYTQQTSTRDIHGHDHVVPARQLTFIRGTFTTRDPQQQDFLDNYPGIVTREVWETTHIPLKERQAKTKRELAAAQENLTSTNEQLRKLREEIADAEAKKAELAGASK